MLIFIQLKMFKLNIFISKFYDKKYNVKLYVEEDKSDNKI